MMKFLQKYQSFLNVMKQINFIKIFILLIIGIMISFITIPIIELLSGLIGFGIALSCAYLILCCLEEKYNWKWLKNGKHN